MLRFWGLGFQHIGVGPGEGQNLALNSMSYKDFHKLTLDLHFNLALDLPEELQLQRLEAFQISQVSSLRHAFANAALFCLKRLEHRAPSTFTTSPNFSVWRTPIIKSWVKCHLLCKIFPELPERNPPLCFHCQHISDTALLSLHCNFEFPSASLLECDMYVFIVL